jgi:hypothetical protein
MLAILLHKGINKTHAQVLVTAFTNQLKLAKEKHLSPPPCFRDLMRVAKEMIASSGKNTVPSKEVVSSVGTNMSAFFASHNAVLSSTYKSGLGL